MVIVIIPMAINNSWQQRSLSLSLSLLSTDFHSTSLTLQQKRDECSSKQRNLVRKEEEKKDLSSLVRMRERKKGVREVVQKCMLVARRESTAKQRSESMSFSELVSLCLQSVEDSIKSKVNYNQIVKLDKSYDNDTDYGNNYNKNNDNNDNYENNNNGNDNHHKNKNNLNNDDNHGNITAVSRIKNKNESSYLNRNNEGRGRDEYHIKECDDQICNEKKRRAKLVQKLLEHPATYVAVLDILGNVRTAVS